MEGYIKLYRKIKQNPLWREERFSKAQAWIDLLLRTNFQDSVWEIHNRNIKVKRGSFITSQRKLAKEWKWSVGKVNYFLAELEQKKMIKKVVYHNKKIEHGIEHGTEHGYTLVLISNWDKYQPKVEHGKNSKVETDKKVYNKKEREREEYSLFKTFFTNKINQELGIKPSLNKRDKEAYLSFLEEYSDKKARDLVDYYFESNLGNKFRSLATILQPFVINAWLKERKAEEENYE
ncbi:MAG: hypothetical protein ACKKMW_02060 [Candidatus Nealsonbacteria bacterium]